MPVDRATHRRIKDKLLKAITKGVQVNGKFVFKRSQEYVPVRTGQLKKSGGFVAKKDGWILNYKAPYAADVHSRPYSSDDEEQPKSVGTHIRKAFRRKDGTQVKATQVKGYYTSPSGKAMRRDPRQGGQYLTRAAEMELPDLTKNVFQALQKQFGKVKLSSSTGGKPASSGGNPTSKSGGKPQSQGSKHKNKFGGKR
jgi:hypothetical protein|tara:strand:+ start:655 stop:1245 length:591 start_codon:yes stop_codon:yes gene_type:complete